MTVASTATGSSGHGVLQRRGRTEVHAGAEPLLVDPAAARLTNATSRSSTTVSTPPMANSRPAQAASTARTPRTKAPTRVHGQALAEERRRQQGGDDGIHRDDHRAQHRRRAVHQRQVQADELQRLGEQPGDQDMRQRCDQWATSHGRSTPRRTGSHRPARTGIPAPPSATSLKQQARQWDTRAHRRTSDSTQCATASGARPWFP